mgnify:CR=1 FL=1
MFPQFPVYSFRRDSRSILRERVNVVQVEASRLTRTKHEQLLALCSRKSLAFARNSHFLFFLFFFFFLFFWSPIQVQEFTEIFKQLGMVAFVSYRFIILLFSSSVVAVIDKYVLSRASIKGFIEQIRKYEILANKVR